MTLQEMKHGSPRTSASAVPDVVELTSQDLIDEDRVFALQALNKYQAQTKAWRDHAVVPREFNEGDLVLVRTTRTESRGKLEPKWEGRNLAKTWNIPGILTISVNFLFKSSGLTRPCNSPNSFIPARTLFLPGVRFLMRQSHVIYMRKSPAKN
jgi:hypothetical protein